MILSSVSHVLIKYAVAAAAADGAALIGIGGRSNCGRGTLSVLPKPLSPLAVSWSLVVSMTFGLVALSAIN